MISLVSTKNDVVALNASWNFFWEFGQLITKKSRVKVQCIWMMSSPAPGQKTAFFGEFWRFFAISGISCASMKFHWMTIKKMRLKTTTCSCIVSAQISKQKNEWMKWMNEQRMKWNAMIRKHHWLMFEYFMYKVCIEVMQRSMCGALN